MHQQLIDLRQQYQEQRKELEKDFLELRDEQRYLRNHTEVVDHLVLALAEPYLADQAFAIIATAGYGRREQFPQSDVDLLVVYDCPFRNVESSISSLIHAIWDVRLRLGQQVWSLEELETLDLEHYEFALALFNGRFLGGSNRLGRYVLEDFFPRFVEHNGRGLVARVVESTENRHKTYNHTIYQLEPDLKEAPGALRDHLTATWLQRLVGEGGFLAYSDREVESAHRFMQRLRILLHILTGRTDDRLTHPLQEKLKNFVGFGEAETQSGVESLMKEYFLNARVLSGFCEAMLTQVKPVPEGLEIVLDPSDELDSIEKILDLFLRSVDEGKRLSGTLRQRILKSLRSLPAPISLLQMRDQLKALLRPRPGLYLMLSDMYELGLLELLFPEFGTIKARVIRDFYHKYTVDEHTLIAIKTIEELASGDPSADRRFASVLEDTVSPCHLTLGLLFHDVGKSRGGKHADQSARMATRALRRFRFDREEINTIAFLIRNHLAMANVIFRRDLDDEEVIRRFTNLVEDPEKLRLLTLLTYADIRAVAPGTLNDWKKDLLWQLYLSSYRKLTLEFGEERIEEEDVGEMLLRGLDPDLDPDEFEDFLEGFPTRYLNSTAPAEIYDHFRMARLVSQDDPVQTKLFSRKSHYELCVITPDRSRIFARIVGLLSYFEMNILKGYGFANRQNNILDFFRFSDERKSFKQRDEKARFEMLLKQALRNEISVKDLLRGKEQSPLFRSRPRVFSPVIYFEDEHSDEYTIMEIIAQDEIGLLYRISEQIADLNCDINLALISTEGHKAVDVFYLCHQEGKLSPELKKKLSDRIINAIG